MVKLVLIIDRDDDLGEKTGIKSPVIGRDKVLDAAVKLAIADPEDTDSNAMFAGIKLSEELNAEVAVVCGSKKVGLSSDLKIAEQLDEIYFKMKPESVVVVTDGSEDEFILPLIYSRFKVDGVRRVIVKQNRTLESTYFLIKKMLSEPKVARATLVPFGIILIFYSLSLLFYKPEVGIGIIILFLGIYFLAKAYGIDKSLEIYGSAIKRSLAEGRFSFILYILSAMFLVVGIAFGINVESFLDFIIVSISWFTFSGIFAVLARALDAISEGLSAKKYFQHFFFTVSLGILVWGTANFLKYMKIEEFFATLVLSLIIAASGIYFRKR